MAHRAMGLPPPKTAEKEAKSTNKQVGKPLEKKPQPTQSAAQIDAFDFDDMDDLALF